MHKQSCPAAWGPAVCQEPQHHRQKGIPPIESKQILIAEQCTAWSLQDWVSGGCEAEEAPASRGAVGKGWTCLRYFCHFLPASTTLQMAFLHAWPTLQTSGHHWTHGYRNIRQTLKEVKHIVHIKNVSKLQMLPFSYGICIRQCGCNPEVLPLHSRPEFLQSRAAGTSQRCFHGERLLSQGARAVC